MELKNLKNLKIIWRTFLFYLLIFQFLFLITHNKIFLFILLSFILIGILFPNFPEYLYQFGFFVGEINTKFILFLIFYFIICPISFIRKFIKRKFVGKEETFWEKIDFKIEKENFEKMG